MKIIFRYKYLLILFMLAVTIVACKKAGEGGKARINVRVFTKTYAVKGVNVYVKYGSKTSPGTSASDYKNNNRLLLSH